MPLTKPPLVPVEPGQPVTAQGWNELTTGLSDLYDAVLAIGTGALDVSVVFDGTPVAGARVTAEPTTDGQPVEAIPPFADRTTYRLVGIADGTWRVHVAADGFSDQTVEVTVPREDPLPINLARAGTAVPDLFGVGLQLATNRLAEAGFQIDLVFDTTGRELPRTSFGPEDVEAPVLVQHPDPGVVVDPAVQRIRLVIASALRREPIVVMPSLVGLSYSEAATALERVGLRIGRTTIRPTD